MRSLRSRVIARSAGWLLGFALLLGFVACFGDPTGIDTGESVELFLESGDDQYALPGTTLADSLVVVVLRPDGQELEDPVEIQWSVVEGWGASVGSAVSMTGGDQRARTTLTLGSGPGIYRVRAAVSGRNAEPVEFGARAAAAPTLEAVSPSPVVPGQEATLRGTGFEANLERNDILFSGIRAEVLGGGETSLRVRVPPCLNEPQVELQAGLGSLRSDPLTVTVGTSGSPVGLPVGGARTVRDSDSLSCLLLSGGTDREYLAVVHATSPVGGLLHDYSLLLRHPSDGMAATLRVPGTEPGLETWIQERSGELSLDPFFGGGGDAQERLDRLLREHESALLRDRFGTAPAPAPAGRTRVPEVGDRRTFSVYNGRGGFDTVEAEARVVGERGVVYLDLSADGSFEPGDLASFGSEFDEVTHPTVREAFGSESDLDGNDRVVILFTPVVNRLTAATAGGFVGGFFYGVDLLPGREGSNGGEIFYALVPDPDGVFGQRRSRTQVLSSVPSILTHEFQHMVHFNERVLVRGAEGTDAIWLSEALASTAEELVGGVFADRGDAERAEMYRDGNRDRARAYLARTDDTGLVFNPGSGTLQERGAGWLFLEHLRGRNPGSDGGRWMLRELTQTTRTGVDNVVSVVGEGWAGLVTPWTVALYLDGLGVPVDGRYTFSTLDLRAELTSSGGTYPLQPPVRGGGDSSVEARIPSSTASYMILRPDAPEGLAVNVAAPGGGALSPESGIGFTIVRVR